VPNRIHYSALYVNSIVFAIVQWIFELSREKPLSICLW